MLSLTKKFEFDAAHFLPNYDGPCARLHGHRWMGEIELIGPDKSTIASKEIYESMIVDFKRVKDILQKAIIIKLDHQYINEILKVPTCENIILWIKAELQRYFGNNLIRIRLYETPDSFAEWKLEEGGKI